MKKQIIILLLSVLCAHDTKAEDVLQILPQRIYAGSTSEDGRSFTIQMNNDNVFAAFQFDIYLPEGMDLDNEYDPVELSMERFPYTTGRGGAIKFAHDVVYAKRQDGAYRVVVSANELESKVQGNSGDLLTIYYVTDNNLNKSILPVQIKNVVLAISGTSDVKPQPVSSFFFTDETDFSTTKTLDLSELTDNIPHDVVEEINRMTGNNTSLTEIDLTGIDDAGATFTSDNKNCMFYIKGGSAFAESMTGTPNIVETGTTGNRCENLILIDGYDLNITRPFTAGHATYKRTVPGEGWYSLCLPYKANVPQDMSIENFVSLDATGNKVFFDKGEQEANIPCIFRTDNGTVTFEADEVTVDVTTDTPGDGDFTGTYRYSQPGTITGHYALHADGSGFGTAGESAYIEPFRAYLYAGNNNAKTIALFHGDATAVDEVVEKGVIIKVNGNELLLSSDGNRRNITIRHIDGRIADNIIIEACSTKSVQLKRGIYIIDNTKIIVR